MRWTWLSVKERWWRVRSGRKIRIFWFGSERNKQRDRWPRRRDNRWSRPSWGEHRNRWTPCTWASLRSHPDDWRPLAYCFGLGLGDWRMKAGSGRADSWRRRAANWRSNRRSSRSHLCRLTTDFWPNRRLLKSLVLWTTKLHLSGHRCDDHSLCPSSANWTIRLSGHRTFVHQAFGLSIGLFWFVRPVVDLHRQVIGVRRELPVDSPFGRLVELFEIYFIQSTSLWVG